LSVFTGIFTRTGASDDQTEGKSTFMNEMVETSNMLNQINNESFVIIDELGRGTSVFEGLALSQTISEYIIKNKSCFCLFATHFRELTELEKKY
jgi:DNA mismatch repair ATPase MutS